MRAFVYLSFLFLILINCAANRSMLSNYSSAQPARVTVSIELTKQSQSIIVDSLINRITQKLQLYSEERKDFIMVDQNQPFDYKLTIKVTELNLIGAETQDSFYRKRDSIYNKYYEANDSMLTIYKKEQAKSAAAKVTTGIAATVVLNALTMPLGISVFFPMGSTENEDIIPAEEQKKLNTLYSQSFLSTTLKLSTQKDSILWQEPHKELLSLSSTFNELQQVGILIRNTIFYLESKLPFFQLKN
jgi:hypothetical protein